MARRNKDINSGQEGSEGSLSQQPHLHIDDEVPRLSDLSVQVHGAHVTVELAGAEVALVIALGDPDDDVVARVSWGGAYPEDLCGHNDVGLEAELVVGDAHWGVLAFQRVGGAADPLAARVSDFVVVVRAIEGQTPEASLEIIAALSSGAVMSAS